MTLCHEVMITTRRVIGNGAGPTIHLIFEATEAPGATANYFTKSDLPFEMSPTFFRPGRGALSFHSALDKYSSRGAGDV